MSTSMRLYGGIHPTVVAAHIAQASAVKHHKRQRRVWWRAVLLSILFTAAAQSCDTTPPVAPATNTAAG